MALITTFAVSLVLSISFLLFKMWEDTKSKNFLEKYREFIDKKVIYIIAIVYQFILTLPKLLSPKKIAKFFLHKVAYYVARGAKRMETKAHDIAMRLSYHDDEESEKGPSEFLKQVSDHKKGLEFQDGEDD